ncbi:MAG TPA: hypothetical protein VEO01_42195, partial [Pseudonocardiaceae bacterium]|nr:hypothetical protein [Pseudonocardiaceae bacterium]
MLAATKKIINVNNVFEYQWLGDLTLPATGTYCYRVYLGGTDLLGANASPTFTTQVPFGSTESFSFDVFGDWGSFNKTDHNTDQANLMAQIAASGARFALTVGDNGYPNGNQINYGDLQQTGVDTSAIFGPKQWTVPGSSIPLFTAVGNHGVSGTQHTDITTWTQEAAVSTSNGRYQNDVYCCVNGSNQSNYGSEWYAFSAGNVRFYVLDSAWGDLNPGTKTPYDNDAAAHFAPGTPEYNWLLNDLTTHPTQLKFAVSHFPFYADNPDDGTDAALDGAGNLEGLLGQHGVQLVFNGHAHLYQRNKASAAGMPITYVTGGGGAALQPIGPCTSNDLYGIGWSWSQFTGSTCGSATAPTAAAQVFHFLKVTVSCTTVTVAPTDSTGKTFDVQTYTFKVPTDTYIDSAPPAGTMSNSATFTFHASGANATFLCRLDNGTAAACTSPKTYTGLAQAAHTFSVAATVNKSADPTPALATWTVDSTPPAAPTGLTASASSPFDVNLAWTAATDNTGVTGYDIYRDGSLDQSVGPVTSYNDAVLGGSTHQYAVRARDVAGNVSPLSATASATTPPPPAPVFADGFESGDLSAWSTSGGLVVEGSNVNSGAEAVEGNTTNGGTYAKKTLRATYSDAYARVWFNVLEQPSQVNLLRLRDASGSITLGYVYIDATGQLGYHNEALNTNTPSDLAPSPGWHALELHLKVDPSVGAVEIWLDNKLVADLSKTSLNTGSVPVGGMQIGEVQSGLTYDVLFDDAAFGTSRLGPASDSSAPTVPAGVTATATSAFTADVSWSASTDNLGVAAYDVFRDGTLVASVDNGVTWTDIGTLPGTTHGYAVRARDASGNVSALSAEATVTQPTAATPLFSDGFETGDLSGWTTPAGLTVQSANVHSGAFGAAGITTASAAYAKKTLPSTYSDAYARVAFLVNSQASQVTLLRLRDTPAGTGGGYLYLTSAGKLGFRSDALSAGTTSSVSPGPGWHALELHLNISNGAVDVWLDGAAVTDLTFPSINLGTAPIGVMQIGDTASGTWDILFDDAAFGTSRVGPSGDTAPPSTPANLAGTASPFSVALSWDASTDDVGVTGYDVFRDGTLLEQVGAVTTYTDSTVLASSMHQYAVRSRDAAGNVSALSQAVSVTTPAAAAPVFSDGFETGDTSAWTTASALTVQQANAHSGNFAAEGSTTTGATFAKKTLPSTYNDAYARVAFLVSSQASQVTLLRLRDTLAGNGGYVYLTSAGKLGFRSDALAAGTTSSVSPGAGWHALELHLHIATGTVEVWLDGALVPDLTSSGIDLGAASMGVLQIGDTATTGTWDIVFDDAAFSTSRLGPSGDTAPPSTPANLAGAASSPFSVDLTWDASTDDVGVTGYDVFRDGALLAGIGNVLTFTDDAVLAGSSHSYAVRARDGAGNVSGLTALVVVSTPAAVAPLFSDGFETGDTSAWTPASALTVQQANVHSGHFAAEGNTTASAAYAKKTLPSTYSDAYARVAFSVNSQTSQVTLLRLRDTPAGNGGYLYLTSAGKLGFRSDALTTGTVSNLSPGPGWHALELHLNISNGAVDVWMDGAAVPDLTFPSVSLGTAPIGVLQIGDTAAGTWDIAFDDAAFGTSRLGPAGDTTAPSAPANLVGTASSPFSADLSWSASTDDVGVTGYEVFRDGTLLNQLGAVTTYTDSTVLASSAYQYTVWARDAAGNVSPLSAGASVLTPAAATPLFSDGFETGNVSGWSTGATVTVQSATVHSGGFAAESNGTGFAKKTLPSTYADAYARVAFNVITPGSQVTLLRLRDTLTGNGGYLYLTSAGKLAFRSDALGAGTLSSVSPGGGWHALELHLNITTGAVEVWLDGAAVPELTLTGTNLGTAQIGVMQVGDTASGAWDVALDDAAFGTGRLGPSGDVTPPSTPANVAGAASSAFSVDLSWDASTDNVGVTGYDVFRDGTLLKQLGAVTTYTDSTVLASSTHQYTVRARDAAGNVSPVSAAVPVTTPAAATPLFSDAFETGDLSAWASPSGLTVQSATVRSGSFAAEGVAGGPAYAKKTVASTSNAYARVAFSVINAGSHQSLTLPARGTFSYPWFPESWTRPGYFPATQYHPTLGYYNSVDVMAQHVQAMLYGGFQFDVSSWWGQGSTEDVRLPALLSAAHGTSLKIAPYYEGEGNATAGVTGSPNPSSAQITSDLNYIAAQYIADPNYLWIAGKPALFVYGDATDNCSTVDRWAAANAAAGTHFYLVLKVFSGYPTCANHPDNWHQYGGAAAEDSQGTHAFSISPGFYKYSETTPRLTRDPARWATNVHDLNCASADFKLVTTFNEWGEGTSVESADEWATASGYG